MSARQHTGRNSLRDVSNHRHGTRTRTSSRGNKRPQEDIRECMRRVFMRMQQQTETVPTTPVEAQVIEEKPTVKATTPIVRKQQSIERSLLYRELMSMSRTRFIRTTTQLVCDWAKGFVSDQTNVNYFYNQEDRSTLPMCMAYSPKPSSGKLLAIGTEEGVISILDTRQTATQRVATWQGHENSIFTVQWHPDGTQLITGSGDRTARLWDVETQRTLNAFEGHTGTIKSISFYRPNPAVFATSSRDGSVMIWDIRCNHTRIVQQVCYHRSVNHISHANVLPNERITPPTKKRKLAADVCRSVTAVLFMQHRDYLLASSGASDGVIKYWDVRHHGCYNHRPNPTPVKSTTYSGQRKRPYGIASLALDHSGTRIFAASTDNCVYEYDAVHLGPAQAIYTSPSYRCSSFYVGLSVSPDDRFLLCGSSDKSAYIWCLDKTPYKTIASLRLHGHTQEVSQVAWCPHDQDQLSTCSDDGTVRIWRIDHTTAQACRQSEAMRQHYGFVTSE